MSKYQIYNISNKDIVWLCEEENNDVQCLCVNKQCQQNPFICGKQSCFRCSAHYCSTQCNKIDKNQLINKILSITQPYQAIINQISEIFNNTRIKLNELQTQMISSFSLQYDKFINPSELEKQFLRMINKGEIRDFTGQSFSTIYDSLDKKKYNKMTQTKLKRFTKQLIRSAQKVQNQIMNLSKEVKDLHQNFTKQAIQHKLLPLNRNLNPFENNTQQLKKKQLTPQISRNFKCKDFGDSEMNSFLFDKTRNEKLRQLQLNIIYCEEKQELSLELNLISSFHIIPMNNWIFNLLE